MILADTGPLVALCDERDAHHARALREIDRVGRRKLVVLAAVLCEACFLLDGRALRARLHALLGKLEMDGLPEEHGRPFRDSVFAWLAQYADHQPDFADACLAVASSRERSVKVWTFDSEFVTTWRHPDGGRIPVAFAAPTPKRKRRGCSRSRGLPPGRSPQPPARGASR